MTMEDKIEKIEKIDKSLRSTEDGVTETEELARMPPNKQHFDALIAESTVSKTAATEAVEAVSKDSLIDELSRINSKVDRFSKVNPAQLVAQADTVIEQINTIKEKLTTKDLEIKPATQTLLQNKLQHIDENLRVALSKAGIEYTPAEMLENKSVNPVERFLGFLTHGQQQLSSLSDELNKMNLNHEQISPANMLRIQLKVGYISQEIEFFTAVLNKALESTKTVMNVQV